MYFASKSSDNKLKCNKERGGFLYLAAYLQEGKL